MKLSHAPRGPCFQSRKRQAMNQLPTFSRKDGLSTKRRPGCCDRFLNHDPRDGSVQMSVTDHLLYAAAWLTFGVLHSSTAGASSRAGLGRLFGRGYRLAYNIDRKSTRLNSSH